VRSAASSHNSFPLRCGLNQALKSSESIQFPSNIEVVQKYYDKIDVTTITAYDGDRLSTSAVVRTISE
jgi:hypothetical protein